MVFFNNNRMKRRQRNKDMDEATNRGQMKGRKDQQEKKTTKTRHMPQ